jgi:uncharacterized membrane protein
MALLIIGLIIFLGSHSTRIFVESWRAKMIAQVGEKKWKVMCTLIAIFGFTLLVIGYGQARQSTIQLWQPPTFGVHLALLLNMFTFILLASSAPNNNAIRVKLKHPMILGVKVWALAHLLANGTLVDTILFVAFLIWAVLDFRAARQRPSPIQENVVISPRATGITIFSGIVVWVVFLLWGHKWLIGVSPLVMMGSQ